VPVAPPETCAAFQEQVGHTVCARTPELFYSVGTWYEDFSEVSDEQVRELLQRATELRAHGPAPETRLRGARDV